MATVTVSPIHFEDYSGVQFERLVFAYHVRAGWRDLIWHGQSGGDQGRDISGVEPLDGQPARKTIIQYANRDTLTLVKAKGDMTKAVKAIGGAPDVFKFVSRGSVSDRRHYADVDRRQLQVGTWDGKVYRWIGELDVDVAKEAAEQLLYEVREAVRGFDGSAFRSTPD